LAFYFHTQILQAQKRLNSDIQYFLSKLHKIRKPDHFRTVDMTFTIFLFPTKVVYIFLKPRKNSRTLYWTSGRTSDVRMTAILALIVRTNWKKKS